MADEGDFREKISTRLLKETYKMLNDGLPMRSAVKFGILGNFSNKGAEESDRFRVMSIFIKEGFNLK